MKMNSTDKVIRAATAFTVAVVSLIAAVISYSHIYRVAISHGQSVLDARLVPICVDGLIAAASLALLYASRNRIPSPVLARCMLGLGVGATICANSIYGDKYGLLGIALSAWPAVAFIGTAELTIWLVRAASSARPDGSARKKGNEIRRWAKSRGYKVSDRGRIPDEIITAFHHAGSDKMQQLKADDTFPDESWEEYAEHSLTHDDVAPAGVSVSVNGDNPVIAATGRKNDES